MENFYQSFCFEEPEVSTSPEFHTPAYEKIVEDGKKIYKCLAEKCEKVFRFKSDIERHVIVHTKERPFACRYPCCGKSFKRPDALKSHIQVHNEGFPSVCYIPDCSLRFHKGSSLQYHVLKHNEENCKQRFNPCTQKDPNDCDCFLNHFEDLPSEYLSAPFLSTRNTFNDEDFSLKPEKFLHTETGRVVCPKDKICKSSEASKLCLKDFVQLMVCKYLLDENQQMKVRFDIKIDPLKAKYESNLSMMLKKALSNQFDMSDDS